MENYFGNNMQIKQKRIKLDKIIVGSKTVIDKADICNKFNEFFCEVGPKLAANIKTDNKRGYETYLKECD